MRSEAVVCAIPPAVVLELFGICKSGTVMVSYSRCGEREQEEE